MSGLSDSSQQPGELSAGINQFSDSTVFPKLYNLFTEGEPKHFLDQATDPDTSTQWRGDFSSSFGRLSPSGFHRTSVSPHFWKVHF